MEFTNEARRMIEDKLKDVVSRMTLSDKDRVEVEKELRSSYYERAESRASERGSQSVTAEDVKESCTEERTPDEIAACYTRLYAANLRRAGFGSRMIAYLIDMFAIGLTIFFVVVPIWLILMILLFDNGVIDNDPMMAGFFILFNLGIWLCILAIILCYVVLFEGRFGKTIGKYVMGLKVVKTDGNCIGYRDAVLRNIPKFIGNFIFFDAIIMLLFFRKERQRAFDKVANTIVVHLR